ncbi:MAG TPA: phage tail tube protein [Chloroflexota bacterium]
MPALTEYLASRGFLGLAAEATPGTPVAATNYVPLLDESLAREPGIVLEKLLRDSRDTAFVPVLGEQRITGAIDTPLYVDQGLPLLAAAVGSDVYQYAATATGAQSIGGGGVAGGVGSFALAALPASLSVGDWIELHQTGSSTPSLSNLSEVHAVVSISGSGPFTIGIGSELTRYSYPSTGSAWRVPSSTAVFTHVLLPDQPSAGAYKTLTLEKNLGGLASLQFAGAVVGKTALQLTSKGAAKVRYDVSALAESQIAGSVPTYGASAPLSLPNFAVSLFGAADNSVASFELDIDQTAKEFWTFNGGNLPALIVPVERTVTGKFTNIVQSMAYYNDMTAGTTGAFVAMLTQGSSSIVFTLPRCVLTKLGVPLKIGTLLLYDAQFQATYADSAGYSIEAQVTNGHWLPFV